MCGDERWCGGRVSSAAAPTTTSSPKTQAAKRLRGTWPNQTTNKTMSQWVTIDGPLKGRHHFESIVFFHAWPELATSLPPTSPRFGQLNNLFSDVNFNIMRIWQNKVSIMIMIIEMILSLIIMLRTIGILMIMMKNDWKTYKLHVSLRSVTQS